MCAGWPNSCDWQMLDDDRQPSTSNSYTGMSLAANESMLQIFNWCSLLSLKSAQLYSYSQVLKHQTNYKSQKSYSNLTHIFVVVFCLQDSMIIEPSLYTLLLLVRRDSIFNLRYNFFLPVTDAYNFLGTACTWTKVTTKFIKCILIYIQQDATLHCLFYPETALHVLGGTTAHHQERIQLYVQHLVFFTM